ncbi:hypothetical protein AMS68_004719 [Peltaster fructicola]|uniref:Uncharacterized protein n=1 Tax=Peltaster fructicola TaxID=286661 RepID=A0A6H0XWQ1_9PEZI|nr:hypothetical protein AMS68_004719 [Peltaster fructicola]
MEQPDLSGLMQHMIAGLNGLQTEYEKLFDQHRALESKLTTARDQYNELAKLLGKSTTDTPPLSLTSATPACQNREQPLSTLDILELRNETNAAQTLRSAIEATARFRELRSQSIKGVKIWSGPSADHSTMSSKLPSITESPMEQDFTVVGTPSKLECPFAIDPIKAEICGLDSHNPDKQAAKQEDVQVEEGSVTKEGEPGVCPIRFLNQHSPEELATYFEKHKHELPRSHEVCVRRYQSNEQQVRELDAKYSDVAQMIRGLGEKHQDYLPKDLEDTEAAVDGIHTTHDTVAEGRVEKWASNIAPSIDAEEEGDEDGRLPHFSRPLRDVRLGESPSRPWGIQVPAQYLEKAGSDASSAPVQIEFSGALPAGHPGVSQAELSKGARCPFASAAKADKVQSPPETKQREAKAGPDLLKEEPARAVQDALRESTNTSVVFTGPVIIGYGPEDAARFLQSLTRAQPPLNVP